MAYSDDIGSLINKLTADLDKRAERALEILNEETHNEVEVAAMAEFGAYQQQIIRKLFDRAVDEFYSAYAPVYYDRQYGLYDILQTPLDANGTVLYDDSTGLYNRSAMHGDRKGGDLFDKVFMRGWHGGAESGVGHPAPGTPYYRMPTGKWYLWGRPAVCSTSAHEMFTKDLAVAESGEIFTAFKRISNQHNDTAVSNAVKRIENL